ncbi:MAG TPA: hypothetical protein VLG14_05220 [Sphingomonas sp.]|nr:hypothetical protein [Sphingomonas sp.]
MKDLLRADLLVCMRTRQSLETGVIRSLLAAIDNAEALPVNEDQPQSLQARFGDGSSEAVRRLLSPDEVHAVIDSEIQKRLAAAADLERMGQAARAELLRQEARVAARYIA